MTTEHDRAKREHAMEIRLAALAERAETAEHVIDQQRHQIRVLKRECDWYRAQCEASRGGG